MILLILFIVSLVLEFILIFVANKKCWDLTIPTFLTTVGFLGCLICGTLVLYEKTKGAYNFYYEEWDRKYLGLEARIKAWNKGGEDPYLWDDVKKFNSDLEYAQSFANNYWTNWMSEQACNEFETFDIPDYKRSNE